MEICSSKNYNIQIHQYIEKSQDLNASAVHFHVLGMRKTRKPISCVLIKKLERQVYKASHCGSKQ